MIETVLLINTTMIVINTTVLLLLSNSIVKELRK
jgi:hypothetical protein